ncbi:MAG: DUF3108 domain-containing protein [Bacteroidota bacterium]|jgi:hypothetical protein|nr:DUF3108 domain-containing protein [Bacteroidota bacterium]
MRKTAITVFITLLATVQLIVAQKQPYMPGEKVSYQIKYGIVGSGQATLEIKEGMYKGKPVWHAVVAGQTTGFADALYKVRDIYESYIDPETDLPVFTIRNISEGRYRKYNEVGFDHRSRSDSTLLFSDLTGQHTGPKGLLDLVSCFYWFRKYYLAAGKELVPGETYKMMTWFADELYPIILRYKGKETIRIKGSRIECYRFHPVTEVGRVFKTEEDMAMWFTADENFLPVKIRFDIFVGSFHVDMTNYEGLRAPLKFID